jgi:Ca2+/Na+ antiporter
MKTNLQLRYFQEDIVYKLDVITCVMCFGFDFQIAGWVFMAIALGQYLYCFCWRYKMEKENREGNRE